MTSNHDKKLFYGIFVDSLSLAIAADSTQFFTKANFTLDLILLRKEKGTLQTKSPKFKAIKAINKEIWSIVKGYVIESSLKTARRRIMKELWGNCVVINELKEKGKQYGDKLVEGCMFEDAGEDELCCYCLDATSDVFINLFNKKRTKNFQNLYEATGMLVESKDFLGTPGCGSTTCLLGITIKHKDLPTVPSINGFRVDGDFDLVQTAHNATPEAIKSISFHPTKQEEAKIHRRFKDFVKTFNLQPPPNIVYTSPFGYNNHRPILKAGTVKEEVIKGYVPRFIEWNSRRVY